MAAVDRKSTLYCSFCGKSQDEVKKLIAGPTVFICDECVGLCGSILREDGIEFLPISWSAEERKTLLEVPVPSVSDIILLAGLVPYKRHLTGLGLIEALVAGLYRATQPDGHARIRKERIAELKRQMQETARPARDALVPLRRELRRLLEEDRTTDSGG